MPELPSNPAPLADQLVELSALTGGLAHEIRNPLSTLKVNLQLLDEDWEKLDATDQLDSAAGAPDAQDIARRSRKRIAGLLKEAERLERILNDFLKYVGKRELKLARVDLVTLVRELADFYRPQAQLHGIDLRVNVPNEPVCCNIDAHFIKQAILNLLINGQEAMPHGGEMELSVAREDSQRVRIDVRDHGPGIPKDQQEAVFRAYFSTRKGGTGLGLATTRQIIREHGGQIYVHSDPPGGACFTIILPGRP